MTICDLEALNRTDRENALRSGDRGRPANCCYALPMYSAAPNGAASMVA